MRAVRVAPVAPVALGAGLLLAALLLAACRSADPAPPQTAELGIEALLDELYAAFCFDAGGEPDWGTQRRIYLEGAVFVAPLGAARTPVGVGTEQFLTDFRSFATTGRHAATGLHERILDTRITVHRGLAHALVLFEGFLPATGEVQSRGLDSLQLVRAGSDWRVVSFTTEYESESVRLPAHLPAHL